MIKRNKSICICGLSIALMMGTLTGCQSNQAIDKNAADNKTGTIANAELKDQNTTSLTEDELKSKLTNISDYSNDYISEITTTVNTVNSKVNDESVSYIFVTDTHLGADNEQDDVIYRELEAAVDIANNTDLDFICIGGDTTDGRFADEQGGKQRSLNYWEKVCSILNQSNKPVLILKGNHDDNSFAVQIDEATLYNPDYILNNEEWYQATMGNFAGYTTDYHDGYYYYDLPGKDVRVVCLNMSDTDDTVVGGYRSEIGLNQNGYTDEQINWLLHSAMTRENCEYLILSHDGFEYPVDYRSDDNRETLKSILTAAIEKTRFEQDGFLKDFTDWTGKIDLFHSGHFHMERTIFNTEVANMPTFTTESARIFNYKLTTLPDWLSPSNGIYSRATNRQINTKDEAVFDIVIKNQDVFDFVRFGDGDDWQLKK